MFGFFKRPIRSKRRPLTAYGEKQLAIRAGRRVLPGNLRKAGDYFRMQQKNTKQRLGWFRMNKRAFV